MAIHRDAHKKMIVGVGSALVDILAKADDEFLRKLNAKKGGMIPVDDQFISQTLKKLKSEAIIVPGGSACNTIIGVRKLGGAARFIGKRGEDNFGELFQTDLKKNGLDSLLFRSSLPTGRVLSIITPDAQRTMFTYLGAASEMAPGEITEKCFTDAAIVHIEGYLLFNKELIMAVLKKAKQANALVSLDLASFTVVEESKDILRSIINDYVDILIANEDEALAFTGHSDETKAIEALSQNVDIAVLKLGKQGSLLFCEGKTIKIDRKGNGSAVDTTGAGDLWASGFLFGFVSGKPYEKCGELGSACGHEVCQVIGAAIPQDGWDRINKLL